MMDAPTLITFTRGELMTSMRVLLVGLAEWVEQFLEPGVIPRGIDSAQPGRSADFSRPGVAGRVIEESHFIWRMQQVFEFVTTGVWSEGDLEEFGHELHGFRGLCDLSLMSEVGMPLAPSIDVHRLPTPQQMCRLVLDHCEARWMLYRDERIDLTQVAMLAGLAEKTVRMAANPKGKDPLATVKDGHRTFVEPAEALRWLSTKPGFRPTLMTDRQARSESYLSIDSLSQHCRDLRERTGLSPAALLKALRWSRAAQTSYRQLEHLAPDLDPRPLTVPRLLELGHALRVEDATGFARSAALVLAPIAIDLECRSVGVGAP